jgi:signal transduction histidine kinase
LLRASERILDGTEIRLAFSVNGDRRALTSAIEDNLLRICEEALTNVVKHSGATEVNLALEFKTQKVTFLINDNGCGFDPKGPEASKAGHFGLGNVEGNKEL